MRDRYVANLAAVAHDDFDNETVLINFERGTYFSLRDSAMTIWAMAQVPVSLDDLLSGLTAAHGTLPPEAPAAVAGLLHRLCEEGCMLRTDTGAGTGAGAGAVSAASCAPVAAAGAFALPVIEAFHDLEELIAIDPVHDTHEFTGWPHRPPSYVVER